MKLKLEGRKGRRWPQSRWEETASPGLRTTADSDGRKKKKKGEVRDKNNSVK